MVFFVESAISQHVQFVEYVVGVFLLSVAGARGEQSFDVVHANYIDYIIISSYV